MNQLRFAALARVSDKHQASERKTSLESQTREIETAVSMLGGKIVKWYKGQEHATPDFERKLLDQLLEDSGKDLFDAAIVTEPSRFNRDTSRFDPDLKKLRGNGIKFYSRARQYSLYDPQDRFELGAINTNQFFAEMQAYKCLMGKVEGAKKGFLTTGKRPPGRTYDKKRGWGLDELKQRKIAKAVETYLAGRDSFESIAKLVGISTISLWYCFTYCLGDKLPIHFKSERFNIFEDVTIDIPRLVSPELEQAVKARLQSNKTCTHGQYKHFYLLSRMIFCGHGHALGVITVNGSTYYRHRAGLKCEFNSIKTGLIDNIVMKEVFTLFGDVKARERAMRNAAAGFRESDRLKADIEHYEQELARIAQGRDRVVGAVEKGLLSDGEVERKMNEIRDREGLVRAKAETARKEYDGMATEEYIEQAARNFKIEELAAGLEHSHLGSESHLNELTDNEKRGILQNIFNGRFIENGRQMRYGIYIERGEKGWLYSIRGAFPQVRGMIRDDLKVDSNGLSYIRA